MRLFSTLLILLSTLSVLAQDAPYSLSIYGEDYVSLTESTSLNNGLVWDDPGYVIPIGFTWQFMGQNLDQIYISDFGLGGMLTGPPQGNLINILMAYGSDIIDAGYADNVSMSNISYKTEGTFPNRICKIEWNNCGFYNEVADSGVASNIVNFQLWLYEGVHDFDVRFGTHSIKTPEAIHDFGVPWLGVIKNFDLMTEEFEGFWFPSAQGEDIILDYVDNFDDLFEAQFLANDPVNGTVFHFDSGLVSVEETSKPEIKVYPTLVRESATVFSPDNYNYRVFSLAGAMVDEGRFTVGNNVLMMDDVQAGVYILQVNDGLTTQSFRLIKQ